MNSLSWFIYLAEMADHVRNFLAVASGLSLFGLAIAAIPACIGKFDEYMGNGKFYDGVWLPLAKKIIPAAIAGLLLTAIIPSQKTLILIASSEFGERIIKSDDAQSIVNPGMDLIRKWIKQEADKIKDNS